MATPVLGILELTEGEGFPEATFNETMRYLEQGAVAFRFKDRQTAPPGSPVDGDCYLVDGVGSGDWLTHDNQIAFFLNTAWAFITVKEGFFAWVLDDDVAIAYNGSSWVQFSVESSPAPTTQAGATYTAVAADRGGFINFTNAGVITFTIPPQVDVTWPSGAILTFCQYGTGTVTIAPGAGVTIHNLNAAFTTPAQYAIAQLKQVATDVWIAFGDLV